MVKTRRRCAREGAEIFMIDTRRGNALSGEMAVKSAIQWHTPTCSFRRCGGRSIERRRSGLFRPFLGRLLGLKWPLSRRGGAMERGKTLDFSANSAIERFPGTKNSSSDINHS
jgi:hypothetical protein